MAIQVSRTRTRWDPSFTGTFYRVLDGVVINDDTRTAWSRGVCEDMLGKYDAAGRIVDHPLTITHLKKGGIEPLSGSFVNDLVNAKYVSYPTTHAYNVDPAHLAIPEIPSVNADAIKVLALTNPGRNGPGSWGETLGDIGELPGLLRNVGGNLFRRWADGHLTWNWAILPIIRDIERLKNFQRDVERRLRELESLRKKGGLHRRINLGSYSAVSGPSGLTAFETGYAKVYGVTTRTTHVRRWGTVRWNFPSGYSLPPVPPDELRRWAAQRVLGLNPDLGLIWELIPWSFLVDWWRDIGSWLAAQNNDLPAVASPVCIMTHTRTTYSMQVTTRSSWIRGGGGMIVKETKQRDIVAGLPAVLSSQGPGLGSGQLTSLGALLTKYATK